MTRFTFFRLFLITIFLFTALSCNLVDKIGGAITEKEPTSPVVMYVTATPQAVLPPAESPPTELPAVTAEPLPTSAGLTVLPCPNPPDDCPEAVSARDFYDVVEPPFEYTFDIPSDTQLSISTGWNAIDPATLISNLPHMDFFLEIDGEDYYSDLYTVTTTEEDQDDPAKLNGVFYLNVVISGWVPHQTHTIRIGYEVTAPVNDGWDDYEAGFKVEKILHICPDGGCPPAP